MKGADMLMDCVNWLEAHHSGSRSHVGRRVVRFAFRVRVHLAKESVKNSLWLLELAGASFICSARSPAVYVGLGVPMIVTSLFTYKRNFEAARAP